MTTPLRPLASPEADPSAVFRDGMSRVAGAVHIVTTGGPSGRAGFTATAVTAVSDAPPTMLVCLNASSGVAPILTRNGIFAVNTLRGGGDDLADRFAGRTGVRGEARFEMGDWSQSAPPLLEDALVSFICRLADARQVATHMVLIGHVETVRLGERGPSLLYRDRHYMAL